MSTAPQGTPSAADGATQAIASGVRRRLLVLLILPLVLLALLNAWIDYRSADDVAAQQDEHLRAMLPLMADSVIGHGPGITPSVLFAPALDDFLSQRGRRAAWAVLDEDGKVLVGEPWLAGLPPAYIDSELHSEERLGVTWRIGRQRLDSAVGRIVVVLADGSDPRQQWARTVLLRVLLPHLVLVLLAGFAVHWAVARALAPLLALRDAVERRSPRDLSAIDEAGTPEEVRPLVRSINHLFALVNAQAEGQRRFVADAAHQLRTPLAGLQSQVEAWAQAAQGGSTQLTSAQVQQLREATRRTSQLAHQLLSLSRADAGAAQLGLTGAVDLKALCEAELEARLDAAAARHIDLGLEAEPVTVQGQDWLLRELLVNLTDNALRYVHEGGHVTLRCGLREGHAVLEVEDNGPGVPAHELPRIRERFYRPPGSAGEGSGLGLAIADEIARAHQGELRVQAGLSGRGLRVTLWLPSGLD